MFYVCNIEQMIINASIVSREIPILYAMRERFDRIKCLNSSNENNIVFLGLQDETLTKHNKLETRHFVQNLREKLRTEFKISRFSGKLKKLVGHLNIG